MAFSDGAMCYSLPQPACSPPFNVPVSVCPLLFIISISLLSYFFVSFPQRVRSELCARSARGEIFLVYTELQVTPSLTIVVFAFSSLAQV